MEELISVIVPVYNVEKYLPKCIDSILDQDYRNLELILIDDGSIDDSPQICMRYADKDSRVVYLHKDNGGVSSARNEGLKIARGSWIGFVDADDYISKDMYLTLANEIGQTTKSIICCGVRVEDINGNEVNHLRSSYHPAEPIELSLEEALFRYFNPTNRLLFNSPWDKIFRADIAKAVLFEEGKNCAEDFDYCLNCLLLSDGIRYIPDKKYHYRIRPGSITSSREITKSSFDRLFFANKALKLVTDRNFSDDIVIQAKVYQCMAAARLIRRIYKGKVNISLFKDEYRQCRQVLDSCDIDVLNQIKGKGKLLVIIAKYAPWILKL